MRCSRTQIVDTGDYEIPVDWLAHMPAPGSPSRFRVLYNLFAVVHHFRTIHEKAAEGTSPMTAAFFMLNRRRESVKGSSEKLEKRMGQDYDVLRLAFPDGQNLPASCRQCVNILGIAVNVPLEFGEPEIPSCLRNTGFSTAWVLMPKTSMDKDRRPSRRKHDVRFSWQIPTMQPEAKPETVQ